MGPIPLATYMRMCLTSDKYGYYMSNKNGRDQFGFRGDFITSPEISQMFGEIIGIWFVAEYLSQGKTSKGIELIEVGPGRGTLMDDILRVIKLVTTRISPTAYDSLVQGRAPFIVAHEFFDSLPIHAFQSMECFNSSDNTIETPTGQHTLASKVLHDRKLSRFQWREMVVSPTPETSGKIAEFQLTLSQKKTLHSSYLPEISTRYRNLKRKAGSVIEICPESYVYVREFARRIGGTSSVVRKSPSGAAIIIDYGPSESVPSNSLRGIRDHKRVSPFYSPGLVDLSADVDFVALAQAALVASPEVEVHGPVEQASFLLSMGIEERARKLYGEPKKDHEKKKVINDSWKRLLNQNVNGMGKVYKAMAIIPRTEGRRKPVGFGGDFKSI